MNFSSTSLKKLFIVYFFAFLPLGIATELLALINVTRLDLHTFQIFGINGFLGHIIYTIIFSMTFAMINWLVNIIRITYLKNTKTSRSDSREYSGSFNTSLMKIRENEFENVTAYGELESKLAS